MSQINNQDRIGGYIEPILTHDAEYLVEQAIKHDFEYIQIGHIANGLGPKYMFNYYQLRIKKDDTCPADRFEISNETRDYLIRRYGECISIF